MGKSAGIFGITALVLTALLFTQSAWLTPTQATDEKAFFAKKVNLALRRTAHHLLRKAGDDTSRIRPVRQVDAHTFAVQMERSFDYSQLPALLQESLRLHKITTNYDVAVLDCARGELLLGYNLRDFTEKNEVPCGGRKQAEGCYNLQVTFTPTEREPQLSTINWVLIFGLLLTGVGYIVGRKLVVQNKPSSTNGVEQKESRLIPFGQSSLDMSTQTLQSGSSRHSLTYREAKLLRFLAGHPNQVIERDLILKSVWEDEGIIVGRSVDVFVSRLRKLLQDDPTIRIVAVHGVGYRLEIQ
ncbi:winged helix-turn-helix domain-containing protein [Spirosoma sp. KNUC1025]|uniref:winged helix-turn-helix domain-containing protein n=1 Tax=Spirosoma sp. KNUC1025 TaxID=2894082 RepID=UPI003867F1FC|nr:winged helix-turn-helix domain-containing protein [Spirosoma sp. KNUC1025]